MSAPRVVWAGTAGHNFWAGRAGLAPVAGWLASLGEAERHARCGKALAVKPWDFGPPVGRVPVVVCEKWAGVVVPGASGAGAVQGVHLAVVARILAGG